MSELMKTLIIASEKAANIARACRQEKELFNLLIEEKKPISVEYADEKPKFYHDFKTLADVLIQETVRHDIGKQFPILQHKIKGEEVNSFTNTLGETISVEIRETVDSTAESLERILNGNGRAATILATEVHREIDIADINIGPIALPDNAEVDMRTLGIWIDPIDSTAEYINGHETESEDGVYANGLRCVTVLIGAYDYSSGNPIIGIVNQPFHGNVNSIWKGICYWGITTKELNLTSLSAPREETKLIVLSRMETTYIKGKLTDAGYKLIEVAGAGYKLLCVITGLVDAYVLSQGTTYKWDLCGPHAILKALGGRVIEYESVMQEHFVDITYNDNDIQIQCDTTDQYCNKYGVVATSCKAVLEDVMEVLSNYKTTTV